MINLITNANVYRDGNTLLGRLSEIELPAIKMSMEEVKSLGLFSAIELPTGMEKMESKIKWNSIYDTDWKAESPFKTSTIIVKSNMAKHNQTGRAAQVPVTATLTGVFKELPSGTIKAAEKSDGTEHLMTVYYYKLEVDGKKVYEVDVFNNIFFCGETDNLEQFRLNQ